MAGHSKWANIKHRKGAQDAARGKIFTKHIRAITTAARHGDPDPDANSALRLAISKAFADNMPKDTIERAIKRGTGEGNDAPMEFIRYEGYGPNGVAVMVECLTDNKNRTAGEVRHAFTKMGGNLGTPGSVSYLFNKKGIIIVENATEDAVMEVALEAGAEDIAKDGDVIEVVTGEDEFEAVKKALEDANFKLCSAEISQVPEIYVAIDKESSEKLLKMIDLLEDLDDVQTVASNADIVF